MQATALLHALALAVQPNPVFGQSAPSPWTMGLSIAQESARRCTSDFESLASCIEACNSLNQLQDSCNEIQQFSQLGTVTAFFCATSNRQEQNAQVERCMKCITGGNWCDNGRLACTRSALTGELLAGGCDQGRVCGWDHDGKCPWTPPTKPTDPSSFVDSKKGDCAGTIGVCSCTGYMGPPQGDILSIRLNQCLYRSPQNNGWICQVDSGCGHDSWVAPNGNRYWCYCGQ